MRFRTRQQVANKLADFGRDQEEDGEEEDDDDEEEEEEEFATSGPTMEPRVAQTSRRRQADQLSCLVARFGPAARNEPPACGPRGGRKQSAGPLAGGERLGRLVAALAVCATLALDLINCDPTTSATGPLATFDEPLQANGHEVGPAEAAATRASWHASAASKLHIARLFAPESVQNGTQNATLDCMFKFDPKLDQKLTIKWFFEDELEPLYQWIPELNKRVYSDKYEHLIDKSYQVTEDVDWMLQAYRRLVSEPPELAIGGQSAPEVGPVEREDKHRDRDRDRDELAAVAAANLAGASGERQLASGRKLLANKLSRLAKSGGEHSRQLLRSLRQALAMEHAEVAKYRALRLVRPPLELAGRFTCSVSSLDSDDLQSTRLVVFEPPRSFAFNVSRTLAPGQFNLSCQAGFAYPRPALALYRYRARQPEPEPEPEPESESAAEFEPEDETGYGRQQRRRRRPSRLAAAQLQPELLAGIQTQLTIGAAHNWAPPHPIEHRNQIGAHPQAPLEGPAPPTGADNAAADLNSHDSAREPDEQHNPAATGSPMELAKAATAHHNEGEHESRRARPHEIVAWTLVDEATLSASVVTQFECVLSLEGTNYEQRQSLALQKGWHVNSQALAARSTLVGLMSVLASVLCLTVALVSALLVFRLMRRHANKSARVHQAHSSGAAAAAAANQKRPLAQAASQSREPLAAASSPSAGSTANSSASSQSPSSSSSRKLPSELDARFLAGKPLSQLQANGLGVAPRRVQHSSFGASGGGAGDRLRGQNLRALASGEQQSDGIYRVPDSLSWAQQPAPASFLVAGPLAEGAAESSTRFQAAERMSPPGGGWPPSTFTPGPPDGRFQCAPYSSNSGNNNNLEQAPNYNLAEPRTRPAGSILCSGGSHSSRAAPATISVNGKQLYC